MASKKKFEPLIKQKPKSTLKERTVDIKDTMNFERRPSTTQVPSPAPPSPTSSPSMPILPPLIIQQPHPLEEGSETAPITPAVWDASDGGEGLEEGTGETGEKKPALTDKDIFRKTTMKTQKMSLDTLLKLEILDPFLRSVEDLEMEKKISINEKVDILIDSYVSTKLSTRQLEGFKAIYENFTK